MPRKWERPERAKALFTAAITLLPFQGVLSPKHQKTQGVALGYVLLGFQPDYILMVKNLPMITY